MLQMGSCKAFSRKKMPLLRTMKTSPRSQQRERHISNCRHPVQLRAHPRWRLSLTSQSKVRTMTLVLSCAEPELSLYSCTLVHVPVCCKCRTGTCAPGASCMNPHVSYYTFTCTRRCGAAVNASTRWLRRSSMARVGQRVANPGACLAHRHV